MKLLKPLIFFYFFCFYQNISCQEILSSNIKFVLSEAFNEDIVRVIDFAVRTNFTQYGTVETYIGFTTDKPLPSFVINLFDKENHILFQTDDYYRSNPKIDFKNTVFVYHCYIPHIDSSFIKTIVIEKQ